MRNVDLYDRVVPGPTLFPRRPRLFWWVWTAQLCLLLAVGSGVMGLAFLAEEMALSPAWADRIRALFTGGGLAVVVIAAVGGGSRLLGAARDRMVAERDASGDSWVFGANLLDDARGILAELQTAGPRTRRLPMTATFEADPNGLSIWEGPVADPFARGFLPWSTVVRIQASRTRIGFFFSRTLQITLVDSRAMHLQPLGSGLLNMFAMTASDLELLVSTLTDSRNQALHHEHRDADRT